MNSNSILGIIKQFFELFEGTTSGPMLSNLKRIRERERERERETTSIEVKFSPKKNTLEALRTRTCQIPLGPSRYKVHFSVMKAIN